MTGGSVLKPSAGEAVQWSSLTWISVASIASVDMAWTLPVWNRWSSWNCNGRPQTWTCM